MPDLIKKAREGRATALAAMRRIEENVFAVSLSATSR